MKKIFYLAFFSCLLITTIQAQTVSVAGECITGTITLDPIGDIDGKPAFEGTGTVDGFPDVQINIFWIGAPDNVWVLAFDGQPYFQNSCDIAMPPATGGSTCTWSAVSGQTCTGTAALDITGTGTLDVKLTSFTARKNNKVIELNWKTATEINNKGFEIQRSKDGVSWNKIGFVAGHATSTTEKNYQFSDQNPGRGKNFYRLAQYDLDNRVTYSVVVAINFISPRLYTILNNPGRGIFKINMEPTSQNVNLVILDKNGRRILSKNYSGGGQQVIDITNFPAGIYLLRIRTGNDLFIERLVKL